MLFTNSVESRTLDLLTGIMAVPELAGFNLAGGTALALQIGHRKSVDLDFFGVRPFEKDEIIGLIEHLGGYRLLQHSKNILILDIDSIKVDFVNYKYPLLRPVVQENDIRLLSLADIAAMKLGAITGRGRKRDFTDLFFLMQQFSLSEMLTFYREKYIDGNELLVLRSLTYFDDADMDDDLMVLKKAAWPDVKNTINKAVHQLLK